MRLLAETIAQRLRDDSGAGGELQHALRRKSCRHPGHMLGVVDEDVRPDVLVVEVRDRACEGGELIAHRSSSRGGASASCRESVKQKTTGVNTCGRPA